MADTNKVVPLPPGEETLDSNHVGYRWMPALAEYQWWETQREDGTWRHTVCQPVEVEQRAQAYLDQQAQAQQDTAHTDHSGLVDYIRSVMAEDSPHTNRIIDGNVVAKLLEGTAHTDSEPVKDGWIAYDAIEGVTYHDTYKEALEACYGSLEWFRDEARTSREWDDDAAGVWLARIVERSREELCEEMGFSDFNMRPVAHTDWQARAEAAEARCQQFAGMLYDLTGWTAEDFAAAIVTPVPDESMETGSANWKAAEALLRKGE